MGTEPLVRAFYGMPEEREDDHAANFDQFIERLDRDRTAGWPVVLVIDGWKAGAGKSTLGIHICRRLDPKFALDHVVYSSAEVHHAYETLPPRSMLLYDESVLGLLSKRGSRDEELSGLIIALSIVRKNGIGTVLAVPKIRMLDTLVYNGLAPYWIYIEDRGRGRVHRAHKGARYRNSQRMIAYDRLWALSPISWRSLDRDPFFRTYNDQAVARNRGFFREQQAIAEARRRRLLGSGGSQDRSSSPETGPDRTKYAGGAGGSPPPGEAAAIRPEFRCGVCSRKFDNAHNLEAHRCAGGPG